MNNKLVAVSGFVLVLISLITTVGILAFEESLHELKWMDVEGAALGSVLLCLVGTLLGWISFKNSTGKVAGIIGSLILGFYIILIIMNARKEKGDFAPALGRQSTDKVFLEQESIEQLK
jgi:Na+/proline symporter